MNRKVIIAVGGLIFVAVLVVAGSFFWNNSPGPDRSDLVRRYLDEKNDFRDPTILRCQQVRDRAVDRVRSEYPDLEIVDCTIQSMDGLGNSMTGTHQFWILGGNIIHVESMSFNQAHGKQAESDVETYVRGMVERNKDRKPAQEKRNKE